MISRIQYDQGDLDLTIPDPSNFLNNFACHDFDLAFIFFNCRFSLFFFLLFFLVLIILTVFHFQLLYLLNMTLPL